MGNLGRCSERLLEGSLKSSIILFFSDSPRVLDQILDYTLKSFFVTHSTVSSFQPVLQHLASFGSQLLELFNMRLQLVICHVAQGSMCRRT